MTEKEDIKIAQVLLTHHNFDKIEEKGYTGYILVDDPRSKTKTKSLNKTTMGWMFAAIGAVIIGYFIFSFFEGMPLPTISHNMGYSLLFIVGLLTGFHCVSMCGGFVVSYTAHNAQNGHSSHGSHVMYGLGKTLSYTIIGAGFGLLGSIIAFTPTMRGVVGMFAGIFLIVFGLRMLNIFPFLRKFAFRTPKFISRLLGSKKDSGPLTIGLLNGLLIACGPLQAIYIMAAGTGSKRCRWRLKMDLSGAMPSRAEPG